MLKNLNFYLIIFILIASNTEASIEVNYLKRKVRQTNTEKELYVPSKFFTKSDLKNRHSSVEKKAEKILEIIRTQIYIEREIEKFDILNILSMNKIIIENKNNYIGKNRSIYFLSEDGFSIFALQVYNNGHSYIHINNDDPNWSKGGFKHFSRSISIENLNIYANLDIALDKPRSLEKHIEELKIMDDHQLSKYNLTYRDYDIYNSKQEDNVVSKMTIQTKLFSHDLSLVKNKGYTLYEKLKISFLIVKSIREMHKKGYIHRDIKSKNILLQRVNNNIEVSLADYGLSLHQKNSNFGRHIAGTRGYIAPESCLSKNQSGFAYLNFSSAKKSDIFSLALTLDELFFDNYKLKEFTTEVNNISLPKDKKKPINSLRLKESVASYNREHKKILESIIQVDRGDTKEKQIMYHLKRLIWQMSHPNYEERPTLSHIGKTLVQLKKFCNSDEVELQ